MNSGKWVGLGEQDAPCSITVNDGTVYLPVAPDELDQVAQYAQGTLPAVVGEWLMACPAAGLIGLFARDTDDIAKIIGTTASTVRRWRSGANVMPRMARLSAVRFLGLAYDGNEWRFV